MDFLELQIKFHTDIIEVHKNHIKLLKETYKIPDTCKSSNKTEKYINKESKSIDNANKSMDDSCKFNMIVNGLDDQELVWDRIRNAHPDRYNSECVNLSKEPLVEPVVETKKLHVINKQNNIKVPDSNKLFQDMSLQVQKIQPQEQTQESLVKESQPQEQTQEPLVKESQTQEQTQEPVKILKVSRLSKFNDTRQHQIIKNIYLKAKLNMDKLAELDNDIKVNIAQKINEEADRLLESYLNEPNGS
jgi:hypothetical protein